MVPLVAAAIVFSWAGMAASNHPTLCEGYALNSFTWIGATVAASAGAALYIVALLAGWLLRMASGLEKRRYTYPIAALCTAILTGAIAGAGLYGFARFDCATSDADSSTATWQLSHAALAVPTLLGIFWLAVTVHVGLSRRWTSEEDREWWSRASAVSLGLSLLWIVFVVVVLCIPRWALSLPILRHQPDAEPLVYFGTAMLGAIASAWGYWGKRGSAIKEETQGIASRLGLRVLDLAALVFVVLLLSALSLVMSQVLSQWLGARIQQETYKLVEELRQAEDCKKSPNRMRHA